MTAFHNKVAIITGGASGIGAAVGKELAKRGVTVVLADINGELAASTAAAIRKDGGQAESTRLDVTDASAVSEMVYRIKKEHDAELNGYNLWIKQQGDLMDTWVPSAPHRHGFYKVSRAALSKTEYRHPHSLLLDYGRGNNPWHQPSQFLRDYIVQVYPDNPKLLIGKAYFALGSLRIFGGNFVMERSATKSDDSPLT